MGLYEWNRIEREQLNPLCARQVIHGESMTVAQMHLAKGCIVPRHQHVNEQICMVTQGMLKFIMDDGDVIVNAGEVLQIPPNVPHRVEALEDSLATDLFSPVREDWVRGDDAYLRRS